VARIPNDDQGIAMLNAALNHLAEHASARYFTIDYF
jgi:hypothetical protein